MYNLESLSADTVDWVFEAAMNELHAYLCEVDFHQIYGARWPTLARGTAACCRELADAATDDVNRDAWLTLAKDYEETISA